MRTLHSPRIYIRNGWYWIQYWEPSTKKQVKKSTAIQADSKDWKRSKERKKLDAIVATVERNRLGFRVGIPTVEQPRQDITLQELLVAFNEANRRERGEKSQKTLEHRAYAVQLVGKFINGKSINSVTRDAALSIRDTSDKSPATIRGVFTEMRILFNYAVREGHIKTNPFSGILVTLKKKAPRRVLFEDEKKVFRRIYSLDKPLFCQLLMLRLTGLRANDVCDMKRDILKDGVLIMDNGKGNREEIMPLTTAIEFVLKENNQYPTYLFKYRNDKTLYHYLQKHCEAVGIENIGLHQLKKNYAFEIANAEPDERTYDALLHHSPTTNKVGVQHYSGKIHRLMKEVLEKAQGGWVEFFQELSTK